MRRLSLIAMAAALGSAMPAIAQTQTQTQTDTDAARSAEQPMEARSGPQSVFESGEIVPLNRWQTEVYDQIDGMSARRLIGSDVRDPSGEDIGNVEDIVVRDDGTVVSLIAEVGGFLDIGDTHVSVPWSQIEISADDDDYEVAVPVTEERVEEFDLFDDEALMRGSLGEGMVAGVDDAEAPMGAWRVEDLIGDYARLRGEDGPVNYGMVSDIVIADGMVQATVVTPSARYGGGMYGYPSYAYPRRGWVPGSAFYDLPYTEDEVGRMRQTRGDGDS